MSYGANPKCGALHQQMGLKRHEPDTGDKRAVFAFKGGEDGLPRLHAELGVIRRHRRVGQHDVVVGSRPIFHIGRLAVLVRHSLVAEVMIS